MSDVDSSQAREQVSKTQWRCRLLGHRKKEHFRGGGTFYVVCLRPDCDWIDGPHHSELAARMLREGRL